MFTPLHSLCSSSNFCSAFCHTSHFIERWSNFFPHLFPCSTVTWWLATSTFLAWKYSPYSLCMTFSAYAWRKITSYLGSSFPSSILSLLSEFILPWGSSCSFKVMRIINLCIWVTGSYIYFYIHLPQPLNHCRSVLDPPEEIKNRLWLEYHTTGIITFSLCYSTSCSPSYILTSQLWLSSLFYLYIGIRPSFDEKKVYSTNTANRLFQTQNHVSLFKPRNM